MITIMIMIMMIINIINIIIILIITTIVTIIWGPEVTDGLTGSRLRPLLVCARYARARARRFVRGAPLRRQEQAPGLPRNKHINQ